jgi:hypothetical protein
MKIKFFVILFAAAIAGAALFGCAPKGGAWGQPLSDKKITPIADILANPQKFGGADVKISGRIIEECPTGGWFILKENAAVILVDLHPSDFAIPQAVGSTVTAEGKVKKEGMRVIVIGKGVLIK